MPAVKITRKEMNDFLVDQGFREIEMSGCNERVYAKIVRTHTHRLSVRIYTTIEGEVSRAIGKDAIRVMLFWPDTDGDIQCVGSSKRVHRMENWRSNLSSRIADWQCGLGPNCDKCGAPTVQRKGKYGEFWGCVTWGKTKCTGKPA